MAIRLNQEEATLLIDMAKKAVEKATLEFPASNGGIVFDVVGNRRTDVFLVNIDRKGINAKGCSYQGRIKSNNVILMRLDVIQLQCMSTLPTEKKYMGRISMSIPKLTN